MIAWIGPTRRRRSAAVALSACSASVRTAASTASSAAPIRGRNSFCSSDWNSCGLDARPARAGRGLLGLGRPCASSSLPASGLRLGVASASGLGAAASACSSAGSCSSLADQLLGARPCRPCRSAGWTAARAPRAACRSGSTLRRPRRARSRPCSRR